MSGEITNIIPVSVKKLLILTETQCVPNGIAHAPGGCYDVQ